MSLQQPSRTQRRPPPGDLEMAWLIARRAAREALSDRSSLVTGFAFAVLLPVLLVLFVVRPMVASPISQPRPELASSLAFYLLMVGLLPTISAVGIACGQFAGEKERGVLTPLLASPASNFAIFSGKVIGAILPSLAYAVVAEAIYLLGLGLVLGPAGLTQLPLALSMCMLALVPSVACFAASVGSLVSSRVRTFNAAQQIAGLVLMPVWGLVFSLAIKLQDWGSAGLIGFVGGVVLLDVLVTALGAMTWRREEVLAQR